MSDIEIVLLIVLCFDIALQLFVMKIKSQFNDKEWEAIQEFNQFIIKLFKEANK